MARRKPPSSRNRASQGGRGRAASRGARKVTRRAGQSTSARKTTGASAARKAAAKRPARKPAAAAKARKPQAAKARKTASPRKVASTKAAAKPRAATKTAGAKTAATKKMAATTRRAAKPAPRSRATEPEPRVPAAPKASPALGAKTPSPARPSRRLPKAPPKPVPPVIDLEPEEGDVEPHDTAPSSSLDLSRGKAPRRRKADVEEEPLSPGAEADPAIVGGDADVNWNGAYSVGDEVPGGDNPTPDHDVVELIGRSLGVEYQDDQELEGGDEIVERDRHRWELDPASSEDWKDRKK